MAEEVEELRRTCAELRAQNDAVNSSEAQLRELEAGVLQQPQTSIAFSSVNCASAKYVLCMKGRQLNGITKLPVASLIQSSS